MENRFKKFIAVSVFSSVPSLALAQAPGNFKDLVLILVNIIRSAIPVLISLSLLAFFWGVARFILNAGGGEEQKEAKNIMIWGIIALFVMLSVWGIVRLLQATFIP